MQQEIFATRQAFEQQVVELLAADPARAKELMTRHCIEWGDKVVARAWQLGDALWTKYDEKF